MGARRGKRSKLKKWEHPLKSGIWILEVLNRSKGRDGEVQTFGASYQVVVPAKLAGKRTRKQFATQQDAEEFATDQATTIKKHGQDFADLTPTLRREISASLERLKPSGVGLLEAVEFAVRHMRPSGGDRTVAQVVSETVGQKKAWHAAGSLRERSFKDYRTRAEKFSDTFGARIVKDVTLEEIKAWLKSLQLSGRSVKNYRMTATEVLKYAFQKKYRADNPMAGFTRADKRELEPNGDEGREPSILSVAEAERLLTAAFKHPELDLGASVALALYCGIRTEELKRLQWTAVRLDDPKPFVVIDRSIAKKRRIRNVEIPACAQAWLRTWPNRKGAVTRNAYVTDYVKRFAKLTRLAGFGAKNEAGEWVSAWDDNCMRHSFGSYTYALTGDSMRTASLLGHKSSDQVLFDHYRALTSKEAAEQYFAILPEPSGEVIVPFATAAGV